MSERTIFNSSSSCQVETCFHVGAAPRDYCHYRRKRRRSVGDGSSPCYSSCYYYHYRQQFRRHTIMSIVIILLIAAPFRLILGKDNATYWSTEYPLYRSVPDNMTTTESSATISQSSEEVITTSTASSAAVRSTTTRKLTTQPTLPSSSSKVPVSPSTTTTKRTAATTAPPIISTSKSTTSAKPGTTTATPAAAKTTITTSTVKLPETTAQEPDRDPMFNVTMEAVNCLLPPGILSEFGASAVSGMMAPEDTDNPYSVTVDPTEFTSLDGYGKIKITSSDPSRPITAVLVFSLWMSTDTGQIVGDASLSPAGFIQLDSASNSANPILMTSSSLADAIVQCHHRYLGRINGVATILPGLLQVDALYYTPSAWEMFDITSNFSNLQPVILAGVFGDGKLWRLTPVALTLRISDVTVTPKRPVSVTTQAATTIGRTTRPTQSATTPGRPTTVTNRVTTTTAPKVSTTRTPETTTSSKTTTLAQISPDGLPFNFVREVSLCLLPASLGGIASSFTFEPSTSDANPFSLTVQPSDGIITFGSDANVTIVSSTDSKPIYAYLLFAVWLESTGDDLWNQVPTNNTAAGIFTPGQETMSFIGSNPELTRVRCSSKKYGEITGLASLAPNLQSVSAQWFAPFNLPQGNYDQTLRPAIFAGVFSDQTFWQPRPLILTLQEPVETTTSVETSPTAEDQVTLRPTTQPSVTTTEAKTTGKTPPLARTTTPRYPITSQPVTITQTTTKAAPVTTKPLVAATTTTTLPVTTTKASVSTTVKPASNGTTSKLPVTTTQVGISTTPAARTTARASTTSSQQQGSSTTTKPVPSSQSTTQPPVPTTTTSKVPASTTKLGQPTTTSSKPAGITSTTAAKTTQQPLANTTTTRKPSSQAATTVPAVRTTTTLPPVVTLKPSVVTTRGIVTTLGSVGNRTTSTSSALLATTIAPAPLVDASVPIAFDCRRHNHDCKLTGGFCDTDTGKCRCTGYYSAYDCRVLNGLIRDDATCNDGRGCGRGQRYGDYCLAMARDRDGSTEFAQCSCSYGSYGPDCNRSRVELACGENDMSITINPFPSFSVFEGHIFLLNNTNDVMVDDDVCRFNISDMAYQFALSYDTLINRCGGERVGDNAFSIRFVIQNHPHWLTAYDQILSAKCILTVVQPYEKSIVIQTNGNVRLYSGANALSNLPENVIVGEHTRIIPRPVPQPTFNLKRVYFDSTYSNYTVAPVVGPVKIGDTVMFSIENSNSTVYTAMRTEDCTLTMDNSIEMKLIARGCPASRAAWTLLRWDRTVATNSSVSFWLRLPANALSGWPRQIDIYCRIKLCLEDSADQCAVLNQGCRGLGNFLPPSYGMRKTGRIRRDVAKRQVSSQVKETVHTKSDGDSDDKTPVVYATVHYSFQLDVDENGKRTSASSPINTASGPDELTPGTAVSESPTGDASSSQQKAIPLQMLNANADALRQWIDGSSSNDDVFDDSSSSSKSSLSPASSLLLPSLIDSNSDTISSNKLFTNDLVDNKNSANFGIINQWLLIGLLLVVFLLIASAGLIFYLSYRLRHSQAYTLSTAG